MAQEKIKQTAGRDQLGDFAPKFAELNDDVLFGEIWSRTDKLSLRDRSLVTITSRTASPVRKSRKSLRTLPFMPDGRKHGPLFGLPRRYGQKIQPG